jgi:hypothetical protein
MNAVHYNTTVAHKSNTSSAHVQNTAHPQHTAQLQHKVEEDVAFLTNRIEMMRKNARPNQNVLETYETMLKSRKAVLAWLQDGETNE